MFLSTCPSMGTEEIKGLLWFVSWPRLCLLVGHVRLRLTRGHWLEKSANAKYCRINPYSPGWAWNPGEYVLTHWPLGDLNESLNGVIFNLILVIDDLGFSNEIALRWMLLDLTGNKSILIQIMAWCRQATSHYQSQCWPSFMSPYGSTRPQWVNDWLNYIYIYICYAGVYQQFLRHITKLEYNVRKK